MNTFLELQTATYDSLNQDSSSPLFSLTKIKSAINRAYLKIGGMYLWAKLRDAQKTSTQSGVDYYDYPDNWVPDSMRKLEVDGVDYGEPLNLKDYQYEIENDRPLALDRMWASDGTVFFVYPTPTATGNNNISIYGYKTVETLSADGDITIFSYNSPQLNLAIVSEAVAILRNPAEDMRGSQLFSAEAKEIVGFAIQQAKLQKNKYNKTIPAMQVPDYLA